MTNTKTPTFRLGACPVMVALWSFMLMSFGEKQYAVPPDVSQGRNNFTPNTPELAPVDFAKVTKVVLYGEVIDERTRKLKNHTGIDFKIAKGSDVVAAEDGVVIVQGYGEKRGNHVVIKHNEIFTTRYFHFERALVKHGDTVKKGQVIGLVGNTGLSTIPHLHYEVLKHGVQVDPKDYLPSLPAP